MAQKEYTSANWTQRAMRRPKPSPYVQQALEEVGIEYDGDSDTYTYPSIGSSKKSDSIVFSGSVRIPKDNMGRKVTGRGSSKRSNQKRSQKKAG